MAPPNTPRTPLLLSHDALFRYQIVSAVRARELGGQRTDTAVRQVAAQTHLTLAGEQKTAAIRSIYRWRAAGARRRASSTPRASIARAAVTATGSARSSAEGIVELELHQLDLRYEEVRETKDEVLAFDGPRLVAEHQKVLDPLDARITGDKKLVTEAEQRAALPTIADMRPAEGESRPIDLSELDDRLSPLRLSEPTAVERTRRSLERRGQLTAVVAFDDGDALVVVDGFKRLRAARQLGWRTLRVWVLELGEAEATAAIVALHETRSLSEIEEAWLVRALHREHGLSQGAVGHLMSRHKSWVSRRLMLVQRLDEAVQGDVRLGLLSPRAAIALAALPRGNQKQAAELVIARGMTSRQAEYLVRRLGELGGESERQQAMESWPAAAPDKPETGRPPESAFRRPRSEAEQLMSDVATLMRVGVRLEVQLLASPLASNGAAERQALTELAALLRVLDGVIARAIATQEKLEDATLANA